VELLVKPEIDLNIFEMVDALGQKDKSKTLKLFNQHLKQGDDEQYLFSMFVYQIRNLIRVKAPQIGRLDMHPFVIEKSRKQARNFSFEDLKKIYQKLFEIDLSVKTGKINIKSALETFIVEL
jgi:DNA polymerase-3 subunit delta